MKAVQLLDGYEAVVLGTAVRMGRPMPGVVRFAKAKKAALSKIPVAAFTVSLIMEKDTPENRKTAAAYLDPVRNEISLVEEEMFAGKMDFSKLGLFSRFIMTKMVKSAESDSRDWEKIREWADNLSEKLEPGNFNK